MSEPVTIGRASLYLGDCRDILPTLGKVDAVVTDPPYLGLAGGGSNTLNGSAKRKHTTRKVGDPWAADLDWAPLAEGIAEKAVIVFTTHAGLCATRLAFSGQQVGLLTWLKRNSPQPQRHNPRQVAEFAWLLRYEGGLDWHRLETVLDVPGINGGCVSNGERIVGEDGRNAHPAQKPLDLMRRIPAIGPESVCDPFLGTGTTGVAAVERGCSFIGIEREPRYFEIACKRIEEAQRQGDFFVEAA